MGEDGRFNEARALLWDPWAGDRDVDYVLLSDRIVTAAKPHECHICGQAIAEGERHRARKEVYEGQIGTFRFCALCCIAFEADDDGRLIEARYEMHPLSFTNQLRSSNA